jgi:uncharacterized membrane protein YfhO
MIQSQSELSTLNAGDGSNSSPSTVPAARISRLRRRMASVWKEYRYLLIAGGVPAVLFLLLYISHGVHPFGDYSVLTLDLNAQYVGFYNALWNFLHGDGSLLYSFSRELGGEFLGIFDYYVASPFAWIIALFPITRMLEALLTLFTLKTGLMGLSMGFYLHKHSGGKPNRLAIVAFSTMYALCSYAIENQSNSMWLDVLIWLPLLTYGLEELIKKGHFRLFVFSLAITLYSHYYIGYMVCIYVVAYSFFYYFAHNRNNENNPKGERSHFAKSVGRVALWSALAVCMAALTILSAKYSLGFGKNDFSSPSWDITQKFDLYLLLYKFLPSSYDTVRPAGLPFVYCGVLTILMAPAFFLCRKFSDREKVAAGCFILFFVLSFTVSDLDLIWHGFQKPNWLNYRYSFMLSFFLLTLAYRAFTQVKLIPRRSLLLVTVAWSAYILILQALRSPILEHLLALPNQQSNADKFDAVRPFATVMLGLACLLAYFVLICIIGRTKRATNTVSAILAFLICAEMFLSGLSETNSFIDDVGHTGYSTYNNYLKTFLPISETIREGDAGFYRTEKTYSRQKTDNFALQFKGLTCSSSTLNQDVIDLLDTMGCVSKSHWSKYVESNPVTDSIFGIRYLVTEKDMSDVYGEPVYKNEVFEYDEDFTPVSNPDVYRNPYALSLVFGVSDAYEQFHIFTENSSGKQVDVYNSPMDLYNEMITAMLGEDELVEVFKKATQTTKTAEAETSNCTYGNTIDNHYKWTVDDKSTESSITLHYEVPTGTTLYLYIPSSYPREVKVSVNGSSKGGFDGSSDSSYRRIASLGQVSSSDLTLKLTIKNSSNNLYIRQKNSDGKVYDSYIYYVDMEVFADAMTRLQQMGYRIDDNCSDDHLTGSITTVQESQLIATTIPYDEGWNVYVDGEKVEVCRTADALLGFRIEGVGEHTLEMRYMPHTVSFGMAVSALAIFIFILLLIAYRWLLRIPLLRGVLTVPGKEINAAETSESSDSDKPLPGDIGYETPDVKPVSPDAPDDIDEKPDKK